MNLNAKNVIDPYLELMRNVNPVETLNTQDDHGSIELTSQKTEFRAQLSIETNKSKDTVGPLKVSDSLSLD